MNRIVLEPRHASETRKEVFDFLSRLATGETISTATASVLVYSGATAATAPTLGSAAISGSQVSVLTSGGDSGVTYLLSVAAATSLGQTLHLVGFLVILPNEY